MITWIAVYIADFIWMFILLVFILMQLKCCVPFCEFFSSNFHECIQEPVSQNPTVCVLDAEIIYLPAAAPCQTVAHPSWSISDTRSQHAVPSFPPSQWRWWPAKKKCSPIFSCRLKRLVRFYISITPPGPTLEFPSLLPPSWTSCSRCESRVVWMQTTGRWWCTAALASDARGPFV